MTLKQATSRRLTDIRATFESEHTEHTGRLRYHAGTREVAGRIGGVKRMYPETERLKQSPKVIAAAIRRGKGKVFRQVYGVVEGAMLKEGFKPSRSGGVRSVDPHKGKRYCIHCRQQHTKGQHRFHGKGSFQSTHLFSFNPMIKKRRNPAGREFGDIPVGTKFYFQGAEAKEFPGPYYKTRQYAAAKGGMDDPYQGQVGMHKSTRVLVEAYPPPRTNPRRGAHGTVIYGRVLRIEAQKTQKHLCDSACKKAGHRYYHDFKVSPVMYGLPDGSILIKK